MFVFKSDNDRFINHVNDIATLEDIALGYLNDECEARRVANIAGNMKLGELFVAKTWIMACVEE